MSNKTATIIKLRPSDTDQTTTESQATTEELFREEIEANKQRKDRMEVARRRRNRAVLKELKIKGANQ